MSELYEFLSTMDFKLEGNNGSGHSPARDNLDDCYYFVCAHDTEFDEETGWGKRTRTDYIDKYGHITSVVPDKENCWDNKVDLDNHFDLVKKCFYNEDKNKFRNSLYWGRRKAESDKLFFDQLIRESKFYNLNDDVLNFIRQVGMRLKQDISNI